MLEYKNDFGDNRKIGVNGVRVHLHPVFQRDNALDHYKRIVLAASIPQPRWKRWFGKPSTSAIRKGDTIVCPNVNHVIKLHDDDSIRGIFIVSDNVDILSHYDKNGKLNLETIKVDGMITEYMEYKDGVPHGTRLITDNKHKQHYYTYENGECKNPDHFIPWPERCILYTGT